MATVDVNIDSATRDLEIDQADYGGDTTLSVNVGMLGSLTYLNITNPTGTSDELELKLVNDSVMNYQPSPYVLELQSGANVALSSMSGPDSVDMQGMIVQVSENSTLRFTPEMASTLHQISISVCIPIQSSYMTRPE
ncbi:hypothetical protein W822_15540 [Advenella kashmirensis W13003]|uniref:Uncharacterized protein n=1 Tax=Advenella kashmirensis W13003 TaxID=1424334 RepID=V8QS01_9BURK|nr:hypothetical protein [Advenella kashmirensis]ETF02417.1 hypothetical protein W822_15540 [Advenella kashmirensis W13003]